MKTAVDHIKLPTSLFDYFNKQHEPVLLAKALDEAGNPTKGRLQVVVYLEESAELKRTGRGVVELIFFEKPSVGQSRLKLDETTLNCLQLIAGELCVMPPSLFKATISQTKLCSRH